jgi:pimeloyl-ACP methyl ester carboxylesterase
MIRVFIVIATLGGCATVPRSSIMDSESARAHGDLAAATSMGAKPQKALRVFLTESARERYMALYDDILRDWPVPFEEIDIPTTFGKTHVVASGPADAPPLVLLHAMMMSATEWRPNVASLSENFRVYCVDVIGQSNKSVPVRKTKTLRDYSDWLVEVFDGLHIAKASLIGNSHGGFLAVNQAIHTPERLHRIVLIAPSRIIPTASWAIAFKYVFPTFLGTKGMKTRASEWLLNGISIPASESKWLELTNIAMTRGWQHSPFGLDFEEDDLRAITTPTLLLIGDGEVIYKSSPEEALQEAKARIPIVEGEIVPGSNHVAAMVQPDYVNARMLKFLDPSRNGQ